MKAAIENMQMKRTCLCSKKTLFTKQAVSWIDPWPYFAAPLLHIQSQLESSIVRKILFLTATKRDEQFK